MALADSQYRHAGVFAEAIGITTRDYSSLWQLCLIKTALTLAALALIPIVPLEADVQAGILRMSNEMQGGDAQRDGEGSLLPRSDGAGAGSAREMVEK